MEVQCTRKRIIKNSTELEIIMNLLYNINGDTHQLASVAVSSHIKLVLLLSMI